MPTDFITLEPMMTVNWFGGRLLSIRFAKDGRVDYLQCDCKGMLAAIFEAFDTKILSEDDLMPCADCGVYTVGEYYMVRDDIWERVWGDRPGLLCIGCLESRLGRTLASDDFTDCRVNDPDFPWLRSERLLHRLTTRPG